MPSSSIDSLKLEVLRAIKLLYARGLVSAVSGNVSARIRGADEMVITASGVHRAFMKLSDIVVLDFNGNVVEGTRKPSIEWKLHLAAYKRRSDIGAVAHAHSPYTLAVFESGLAGDLETIVEYRYVVKEVAEVGYAEPGSEQLAEAVGKALETGVNVVVMRGHGAVAVADTPLKAVALLEALEEAAKTLAFRSILRSLWPR